MQFSKKERDFKGVWIPRHIYLNKDLSWTEKILLVEIHSLDNGEGCFASDEHFAEFLGKAEGTIANLISKLKKLGYIRLLDFDGRKRYLGVTDAFSSEKNAQENESSLHENVKADFTKTLKQTSRKNEHSNTYSNTDEKLLAAEPKFTPNSESFDQFSEKYELQFTPAILSDAKVKLELYFSENDLQKELEATAPISESQFKQIVHSFLTMRVEGKHKKQFKSFPAMHADFLVWAKRDIAYQENQKNKEKAPSSSAPLPHREAHELDDTALQAAIDELGVADKITVGRVRNRIKPLLLFIKNKAAKLGVIQKMSGLTELQCVAIMKMLNFAQMPQFSTIEGIIDQIPQRKDLMQCSSIGEVLRTYSNP